jgi:DNA-directed RNA polymerase subunit K/omega
MANNVSATGSHDDVEDDETPLAPITSRFLFVDVAAQRAKQLRRGALVRLDRHGHTPHKLERVAMEEVRTGLVHYTLPTPAELFGKIQ